MRLLFVADGRSPTALNWMRYFVEQGHEVHLASTYPCDPELPLASLTAIPVAFSHAAGTPGDGSANTLRRLSTAGLRTKIRQWFGPLTLPFAAKKLNALAEVIRPDLIHALRIPFEGMLAAGAATDRPLLVSVWGNDFTLHARSTPLMAAHTRRALRCAGALLADTGRDIRLARQMGFAENKPHAVLPGGGGVRPEIFFPPAEPMSEPVIVNPRGIRAYVRNDTFFKAIPQVLAQRPDARFLCPAMQGQPQAEAWLDELKLRPYVQLLPQQSREEMAGLFRRATLTVSPAAHDGTPNSVLEAMACGSFPIAGDIEPLREWIEPGENGLLFNPIDADALAAAVLQALGDKNLRAQATRRNRKLIEERASYPKVMAKAAAFYQKVLAKKEPAISGFRG
jgi:glycosyltransferase involved in cell wall biosynthesis